MKYTDEQLLYFYDTLKNASEKDILYRELKERGLVSPFGEVLREKFINTGEFKNLPDEELLEAWDTEIDMRRRDLIILEMQRKKLFPAKAMSVWENETGAYPDLIDPDFLQKLLSKREFAESIQKTWKPSTNPCDDQTTFEVTAVQRFVSNFMSPKTPYMSALLFHGVGVGKTCAAVQIFEAWLELYPRQEVFLVAPKTIQYGFFRTIFDISKVKIGQGNEPNTASQCTGTTYMKLTNTLYERDPARIERLVSRMIQRRYKVFGYISFANYIRDIISGIPTDLDEEQKDRLKQNYIRQKFSGKLLVIDEAHNLRDVSDVTDESEDAFTGGKSEKDDASEGKKLTAFLRDVLRYSEGMKFCALTATPMYNSYREIIFMLNLLRLNDKKAPITEADVFDPKGQITPNGKMILAENSQHYVSFMRGENPISFPVRLFPEGIRTLTNYPLQNPRGMVIPENETGFYQHLPLVPIELRGATLRASILFMNALRQEGKGLSTLDLEKLVHAGNIVVPPTLLTKNDTYEAYVARTNIDSIQTVFQKETMGGEARYRAREEVGAGWLAVGELAQYSPKFDFFINRVRTAEGCIFAYTRFVSGGALPLALALEANGYLPYGRKSGLLANGIQTPGGRQCALCPAREKNHGNADHAFVPAYYGILTGDIGISPKNDETIKAQRAAGNENGAKMKIIIGSQLASEGVDLRFIRETHVLDSWYHLNKTEQILGRAIRFLSHCMLPPEKRNTTVYLYTAVLPSAEYSRETADLYSYRMGFQKASLIGNVTRIMKQSALDCNLNRKAIVIENEDPVQQLDSQRSIREEVNINDMPFTAVCDWIESCSYQCKPTIPVKDLEMDDTTYDEYSARWRMNQLKNRIRALFSENVFIHSDNLWNQLSDIPRMVVIDLLSEIINNKTFQVEHIDENNIAQKGYIRYCNGYYLFQPNAYQDLTIPLAVRIARFPVKRDMYLPIEYEPPEIAEEDEKKDVVNASTVETFWKATVEWIDQLIRQKNKVPIPTEMDERLLQLSGEEEEKYTQIKQMIEMIELFHESYHQSDIDADNEFRRTLLFYFWDEWLSFEDQKHLVFSSTVNVGECIEESNYQMGRLTIQRFIDMKMNQIYYFCEEGTQCAASFVNEILRDTNNDPAHPFPIDITTMGNLYGYNVSKNGTLIFKTNKPPAVNGKIGKGKECATSSAMQQHMDNLFMIGNLLSENDYTDFGLNPVKIIQERRVRNSVRACTLLNLILRFLEQIQLEDRHWFLRPIRAYYTGHSPAGVIKKGGK